MGVFANEAFDVVVPVLLYVGQTPSVLRRLADVRQIYERDPEKNDTDDQVNEGE
jgi:hypothetical protein